MHCNQSRHFRISSTYFSHAIRRVPYEDFSVVLQLGDILLYFSSPELTQAIQVNI